MRYFKRGFIFIATILMLFMSTASFAADITYTGNTADLQAIPSWWLPIGAGASFYPGTPTNTLYENNTVTINFTTTGSNNPYNVVGGLSQNSLVQGNAVTIERGKISNNVYGGYSRNASASNNTVIINGGEITNIVHGGYANAAGAASNNTVIINGGKISGTVNGGYSVNGTAYNNTVTVSGGEIGIVYGGYAGAEASNNSISISNGKISGAVIGGVSSLLASNNTVTIIGGEILGNVYGGSSTFGTATNNSVTIGAGADLSVARLYGNNKTSWATDGNTLNVDGFVGNVTGIANFQYYNFALDNIGAGDTVLNVTNNVNVAGSTFDIVGIGSGVSLGVGDKINLIKTAGTLTSDIINEYFYMDSIFGDYEFLMTNEPADKAIILTLTNASANDESKSLLEAPVANLAMITQGGDLIYTGLYNVLEATRKNTNAWVGFSAIGGGWNRYNTGSHADVYGANLLVGLGHRSCAGTGSFLIGLFYEMGMGSYKSQNEVTGSSEIHADGYTRYYGGGILARYDINRWYVDAAFRIGTSDFDYKTSDITGGGYPETTYSAKPMYVGAQAGVGYIVPVGDCSGVDLYARYLFAYQESSEVDVLGYKLRMDDASSHRVRVGGRFFHDTSKTVRPYIGAGFEYEFDGKMTGTVDNLSIQSPELQGASGFGEVGLRILPILSNKDRALSLDLNIMGYGGQRSGANGAFKLRYEF